MIHLMNLALCGARPTRTIKLIFFTLIAIISVQFIQAERWDSQGAQQAFQEAKKKRDELAQIAKPSAAQYTDCAKNYRKVYVKDPHYARAGDAIFEEAAIYQEMGDKFGDLDYYQTAARRFLLLVKDYSGNSNCPNALERLGLIYSKNLKDETSAQDVYKLLKLQYKSSTAALRLRNADTGSKPVSVQPQKNEEVLKQAESAQRGTSSVQNVRFWTTNDYTRVSIDMDLDASFEKFQITDPDRIYFDISNASVSNELHDQTILVGDGILKQIRVAQNRTGLVRVVLDCKTAVAYSVNELRNPYRIVIDMHPPSVERASTIIAAKEGRLPEVVPSKPKPAVRSEKALIERSTKPPLAITPEIISTPKPSPPQPALPTSQGDRTLTRMLGLKVGRIVIDPGHGGHDQGTIGPGGLFEKDLVLSLAIKLEKMLREKLGAEVVLTRNDDSFIPLEERTAIANQHRADLFISIHANSSKIRSISGVETYYLSFAQTDAEREIAARENATTINNVADLEDLIKKIAQADKSVESKELASAVQKKLYSGARQLVPATQNRGVRSAPFIVLIGANMPSVLTEVAFISNPKDEKLLKKENNQEHLVKALFSGIESYINTLGSDANLNKHAQKQ